MPTEVLENAVLFRGIERSLVVIGGIACIVVGAILYKWGVAGDASLKLEQDKLKFQLLNASPGLFFGLFGVAVLLYSLANPFSYKPPAPTGGSSPPSAGAELNYARRVGRLEGFLTKAS